MNLARIPLAGARCIPALAGAFLFVVGVTTSWAEEKPSARIDAEPIYELPKFVVTDSRALPEPESWRYATLPGFEVLSNSSDRTTKRLLGDFQLFRQALDIVWPMPPQLNTPVLLILCGRGGKFESFVPAHTEGDALIAKASVYLKGRVRSAIVIDTESTVVNILAADADDADSGVDSTRLSIDHNKQLYREYVHYLLSRSEPRMPAWFEEGMAQIIMAMKFDNKYIEFGRLQDPNEVSAQAAMAALNASAAAAVGGDDMPATPGFTPDAPAEDRDFNAALARRALIPMPELLAVDRNSPAALNPLGNNTWAKQCYAFVHLGLFGEKGRWRKPFSEFLIRSTREPVTEAMFKDCFKMSFKDMNLYLRGYIQSAYYQVQEYHAKGGGELLVDKKVELRDATPAEVGRIKGQAMLLAGKTDAARTEFIAPYIRGERDPQLLAALGLAEHQAGKDDRARLLLTAAVNGKSSDPDAYLELARLQYADATAKLSSPNAPMSEPAASGITKLLLAGRAYPPPNPALYELLADTLIHSPRRPTRDDVMPLVDGVRIYPTDLKLVYKTAALCLDAGIPEAADSLATHGLKLSTDAVSRNAFQNLKAQIPPIPPEKSAPAPASAPTQAAPHKTAAAGSR